MECGYAKVLIKQEEMLRLSDVCKSKKLWSVGYGSTVFDASNEWYFGGPEEEWSVKVPDIYWGSLGSTMDIPKRHEIIDKGISW